MHKTANGYLDLRNNGTVSAGHCQYEKIEDYGMVGIDVLLKYISEYKWTNICRYMGEQIHIRGDCIYIIGAHN